MKKILALACLLALVAILVVPMAATAAAPTTPVSGTVKYATVSMTAPSALAFNTFKMGWNYATAVTPGKVTVVPGTSLLTNWTVTAAATSIFLGNATDNLDTPLLVGPSKDGPHWFFLNGGSTTIDGTVYPIPPDSGHLTYSGTTTPGSVPFAAAQFIKASDITAGSYSVTVTFTVTCDL